MSETFDPKPQTLEVRGPLDSIATAIPGTSVNAFLDGSNAGQNLCHSLNDVAAG